MRLLAYFLPQGIYRASLGACKLFSPGILGCVAGPLGHCWGSAQGLHTGWRGTPVLGQCAQYIPGGVTRASGMADMVEMLYGYDSFPSPDSSTCCSPSLRLVPSPLHLPHAYPCTLLYLFLFLQLSRAFYVPYNLLFHSLSRGPPGAGL